MAAPLLCFYGDDFTGSSAVMEVLAFAGVETMLFLRPPDDDVLARYPDLKVVGVAGVARSKDPDWMRVHLPAVFQALQRLGAPMVHYKVCSTFDSSPQIGSIGVAADIGREIFAPGWTPLVVGAPAIGRYQVFGTLFAAAGDGVHRLDRHPVMARHPVTPMDEADLGVHLGRQTAQRIAVLDYVAMAQDAGRGALETALDSGAQIVALDAMDHGSLEAAGSLIWGDGAGPGFALGSQGVEYALVAHWRQIGLIDLEHSAPILAPVEQLFAVSGSCSATTGMQIACAEAQGFVILEFDARAAAGGDGPLDAEVQRQLAAALGLLGQGRDVLVTTARGPDDPAIAAMGAACARSGVPVQDANARLGQALGRLVAEVRRATGMPRAAIGGGDTSGYALTALEAEALSAVAPLAPGAPLCRVHASRAPGIDGLEVTLKGGQMGAPEFFVTAKTGG